MRKITVTIVALIFSLFFVSLLLADTYTAYSFKLAQKQFKNKKSSSEALHCEGITQPIALVYDKKNEDVILVGKKESGQKSIHHDDWVVAIKAILKEKQDPRVSLRMVQSYHVKEGQVLLLGKLCLIFV